MRQRRADERKPLVSRQAAIEQELERLDGEKSALDEWLATTRRVCRRREGRGSSTAIARQGELTWTLARLESEWLEIARGARRELARRCRGASAPRVREARWHAALN